MKAATMNRHLIVALCCLGSLIMTSNPLAAEPSAKTRVTLQTNQGNIEVELFCDVAPVACKNFIGLAKKGYYDGGIFHRVIKGFMIQGGDPTGTGRGGESLSGRPFEDEVSKSVTFDKPGLLAMANAGPGTNGSQFFITVAATPWLNMHHTIFGRVTAGYDVVEKIAGTSADSSDRPIKEQKIQRVLVEEPKNV
jgi:peptidylprolyl isomerase